MRNSQTRALLVLFGACYLLMMGLYIWTKQDLIKKGKEADRLHLELEVAKGKLEVLDLLYRGKCFDSETGEVR